MTQSNRSAFPNISHESIVEGQRLFGPRAAHWPLLLASQATLVPFSRWTFTLCADMTVVTNYFLVNKSISASYSSNWHKHTHRCLAKRSGKAVKTSMSIICSYCCHRGLPPPCLSKLRKWKAPQLFPPSFLRI